jgi:hypothetical protein
MPVVFGEHLLWGINGHSVGDGGHGVRLHKRQRLKKPK